MVHIISLSRSLFNLLYNLFPGQNRQGGKDSRVFSDIKWICYWYFFFSKKNDQ